MRFLLLGSAVSIDGGFTSIFVFVAASSVEFVVFAGKFVGILEIALLLFALLDWPDVAGGFTIFVVDEVGRCTVSLSFGIFISASSSSSSSSSSVSSSRSSMAGL